MNIKKIFKVSVTCLAFISIDAVALNIALTNDDGWEASGIQHMKQALVDAGHQVTLVAPTGNQSGSSAAIDLGIANLLVTRQSQDEYSVSLVGGADAEPATCGQVAISIAESNGTPVDLLISGINNSANTGAATNASGTVGAAIHAISYLSGNSVPAIAISTDEIQSAECQNPGAACDAVNAAHFTAVAHWVVDFVNELAARPGALKHSEGLLPRGLMLNINYPPTEDIQGVTLNRQGRLYSLAGSIVGFPLGCYEDCANMAIGSVAAGGILDVEPVDGVRDRRRSDTTFYNAGFITIVPIRTDLTAGHNVRHKLRGLMRNLNL